MGWVRWVGSIHMREQQHKWAVHLPDLQVYEEYMDFVLRYSDLIEKLPTRAFLVPLAEDEELEIELAKVSKHLRMGNWVYFRVRVQG
jgi:pyruvate carboxylase